MKYFHYTAPTLGKLAVIGLLAGEKIESVDFKRLFFEEFEWNPEASLSVFIGDKTDPILSHMAEYFKNSLGHLLSETSSINSDKNHTRVLKIKSPMPNVDIIMPIDLFTINKLAIFCDISYEWAFGLQGASAAIYKMYSTKLYAPKRDHEKLTFELSRRLPAEVNVGVLKGTQTSYIIVGESPLLVDAAATKIMRIPLDSISLFERWRKTYKAWDEIRLLKIPSDLCTIHVSIFKRWTSMLWRAFFAMILAFENQIDLLKRSFQNLYRVLPFIRKHILGKP